MKKRIVVILLSLVMAFSAAALIVACDKTPESVEYSVVVYDTESNPVSDVLVTWQRTGSNPVSRRTDADGKAKVVLPGYTYTVTLADYPTGYAYTPASVNADMKDIVVRLSPDQILYRTTVKDKTGAPAEGVTVTWVADSVAAGSAVTNAQGVAESTLGYGTYFVVLSNLPENNVTGGMREAHGNAPNVAYELIDGVTVNYTVTVITEGQLKLPKTDVALYNTVGIVAFGTTGEDGTISFILEQGDYRAEGVNLLPGYTGKSANLTPSSPNGQIELHSEVITDAPADNLRYVMGDIIHDYEFITPYPVDGAPKTYKISELLKTKKAIIINNWGTQCTYCVQEMPAMQTAYEKYSDQIEMIAVSNYMGGDSDTAVINHRNTNNYTFPMMRDRNGFATKFSLTAWPATVVIDRYGAIARIESGAILDSNVWNRLIEIYIDDNYVQTFTPGDHTSDSITSEVAKPDITVPEDHYEKLAEAVNNTYEFPEGTSVTYYPETEYEYAWPFLFGTVEGISDDVPVMYSSNTQKCNSMSVLYAKVTAPAGQVFTFDYYAETEAGYDILYIIWDGKIVREIDGFSKHADDPTDDGWRTCKLYTDLADGEHTVIFSYMKDEAEQMEYDVYADNVYIRNIRFTSLATIIESTDMMRGAAYGVPEEGASQFPYYVTTTLGADGYYHVDKSSLQNSEMAGKDDSPLLLANLLNATNFSGTSLYNYVYAVKEEGSDEYVLGGGYTVNGVKKSFREVMLPYFQAARNSDVTYCVPVDAELHDILIALIEQIYKDFSDEVIIPHGNEWLELCYFYSHYGNGGPIGNPIMGLTTKTAYPAVAGENTANLTRIMAPFPVSIYKFVPETSGVYEFESFIQDRQTGGAAQIWLYDEKYGDALAYCGDDYYTRDGKNEYNFMLHYYLNAGQTYYIEVAYQPMEWGDGTYKFSITNVGETLDVLEPCSGQYFDQILDDKENVIGIKLHNAIKYQKGPDGYYRAINDDGSWGSYIYLDVTYPLIVSGGSLSIKELVDTYVPDPLMYEDNKQHYLDYKVFDFRYKIGYVFEDGKTYYNPKVDVTSMNPDKYKDYTEYMRELVAGADENGFVKVDDDVVKVLLLYIEMHNTMYESGIMWEQPAANEWLRFCYYYHHYQDYNN